METKRRSRRYIGRQSGKIGEDHRKPLKETRHKKKLARKRKIKEFRRLKEK